ncbi:cytochrome P450 [Aspergillus leporis]|uniref:Cytochrome P450 n=1 Tax=Aspergillus leporis TaxID=41062 RepID=A0A5N5WJ96_9EURO|nr:cytochrome P450 [Aspergillus leporis]
MLSLLSSTFTVLVALFLYKVIRLAHNVRLARKTTLPYIITPLLETEVLAFLINPLLRYVYRGYLDRGKGWPRWYRFFVKDWAWEDKRQAHDDLGDVFLCVSPEGIICYSADATMGWDVMNRRNTFTKPRDKYTGQAGLSDFLKRFPTVGRIFLKLNPRWLNKLTDGAIKHQTYTIDLVKRRIQQKTNRKDFMSYLLAERNASQTSDIQLAAHASDFVIAGSETTATCLATAIYYVGRHPRILKALQEEIRSAFQSYEEINGQSTSSLKYLHAVCLEALRIFPPLALGLPRLVPEGGEMIDGHFVPENTIVSTNPLAASLDPRHFDAPWSFCPERWLRLNTEDQLEASQPFSMGPRSCLGRGLAWLELRLTLAKLFYRYDLELVDDELEWHRDVAMHLLWVKPKLMTRVLPRAKCV